MSSLPKTVLTLLAKCRFGSSVSKYINTHTHTRGRGDESKDDGDGCHTCSIGTNTVSVFVLNCYIIDYALSIMDGGLLRDVTVQWPRERRQPRAAWHRLCRVTWFLFFNDLNQSNIDANDHDDMMARQAQHSVLILLLFHTSYCIYLAGFLLLNQFWIIMRHNLNADVIIKLISEKKTVGSISSTILIQTE